jgi:hypothetical protein
MEKTQPTLDKIFKPCSLDEMEATKEREWAAIEEENWAFYFNKDTSLDRMERKQGFGKPQKKLEPIVVVVNEKTDDEASPRSAR